MKKAFLLFLILVACNRHKTCEGGDCAQICDCPDKTGFTLHQKDILLQRLKYALTKKDEEGNGYAYSFTESRIMRAEISQFMQMISACCTHVDFEISYMNGDISVKVDGYPGTKAFLDREFDL